MPERLLIAGGAGFIGSSVAIAFASRHPDWKITSFDNLRRRGSELNIERLQAGGVEFVHGDVRVRDDLAALAPTLVIDCSAEPSVLAGFSDPRYAIATNLNGTANLLEVAREAGARFIFLSTSRVYSIADLRELPLSHTTDRFDLRPEAVGTGFSSQGIDERFSTSPPRTLYGTTKLASELLVEEYHHSLGVPAIINRCGVIAGPWQMGKVDQGFLTLWVAAHLFGFPLRYIGYGGSGMQVRDVLHVEDLVDLLDLQIGRFDDLAGETFNVGGGAARSLSLRQATDVCREVTGRQTDIGTSEENRPGDVPYFVTDTAKIRSRAGWEPQRSLRRTIEEIAGWIREHESSVRLLLMQGGT